MRNEKIFIKNLVINDEWEDIYMYAKYFMIVRHYFLTYD